MAYVCAASVGSMEPASRAESEKGVMNRFKFAGLTIHSAGYDAQREVLEIEFATDGQIWQYRAVEEEMWYRFRKQVLPDTFFHQFIQGRYTEQRIV